MKYSTATILLAYFGLTLSLPHQKREVPQEHSHQAVLDQVAVSLKLDNPNEIQDSVFGLLGDAAAVKGAGKIKNLDCLQRAIADQAFTNEKKAGNVDGMANALIFAALEKNTGAVGKASNTCTEKAVNPEIDAISQHQDPAGAGAQEANKKIVLTLAIQLESIGADPQLAAISATFAPGKLGDNTGAGNTCDDLDDKKGCIFTKKLIQVEATPEEIQAAVKGSGSSEASSAADSKDAKADASASEEKASSKSAMAEEETADTDAADEKASGKADEASDKDAKADKASDKDAKADKASDKDAKAVEDADAADAADEKASGKADKASDKDAKADKASDKDTKADKASDKDAKADKASDKDAKADKASDKDAKADKASDKDAKAVEDADAADAADEKASGKADKASDKDAKAVEDTDAASAADEKKSGNSDKDAEADGDAGAAEAADAGASGDFGSCGSATIIFAEGLDGRKEASFQATNQKDFNHGSALNIKVISDFICQKLQDSCKASADVVESCNKASLAAQQKKGQESADTFNAGIGGKA